MRTPSIMPFPIVPLRFPLSHLSIPALSHNKPVRSPNSICGFHLYYFPQIYSKSLPASEVSLPDSMLLQAAPDGTFYKNRRFFPEYQCNGHHCLIPALPTHRKIQLQVLPRSSVHVLPGSRAAPVYFSYQLWHYTTASASRVLLSKFCKGSFFRSFLSSPFLLSVDKRYFLRSTDDIYGTEQIW